MIMREAIISCEFLPQLRYGMRSTWMYKTYCP